MLLDAGEACTPRTPQPMPGGVTNAHAQASGSSRALARVG
jgi:hypothetical protein